MLSSFDALPTDIPANLHLFFTQNLLAWSAAHPRPLPWKGERDPYKIWLSEIILQQTRVEQGLPYYERFIAAYPTVWDLADAPEDELMKLWEGLGYYSRARNLHAAAKHIANDLGGRFPDTYAGLLRLKGVGDYTAAAVASFAFGLPHAVVDGNVYRVLSRFFGIADPTDTPAAKRAFTTLANQLLDPERPGAFNQAIMDFGATWCTPQQPRCPQCPMLPHCVAAQTRRIADFPAKSKKIEKKERFFFYLVVNWQGNLYIQKRTQKDIWQNLFEFPMIELGALPTDSEEATAIIRQQDALSLPLPETVKGSLSRPYRQTLTHRYVSAVFFEIHLPDVAAGWLDQPFFKHCLPVQRSDLKKKFAFPRLVDNYWDAGAVTLTLF